MKRFSETEKWKDVWFRGLKPCEKLVFLYVVDNCNNAGFYEADLGMMEFQTGVKIASLEGALKGLNRGLKGASGWYWVRRFLRHQKNEQINPENPAHKQIIALIEDQLERFSGVPEFCEFVAPIKGLLSPIGKGNGLVKEGGVQRGKCEKDEAIAYANELNLPDLDGQWFYDKCVGSGWKNNGKPIICWKATMRAWKTARIFPSLKQTIVPMRKASGPNI